jgi:hypothetical protein
VRCVTGDDVPVARQARRQQIGLAKSLFHGKDDSCIHDCCSATAGCERAGYQSPVARVFSTDILRGVPRVTDEV